MTEEIDGSASESEERAPTVNRAGLSTNPGSSWDDVLGCMHNNIPPCYDGNIMTNILLTV